MTPELVWLLIRQDAGGNRYRVGRFATRAEAERVAETLGAAGADGRAAGETAGGPAGDGQIYVIERVAPRPAQA
ncbi:SPOR domain-containing protein [Actinacidiphila sp. DG2A-62]|uniref:SPOR domain-containing protein n=1 Tax=Actinacidiphila sp. DG2A-62 TaxID=3108821 RepID=UPI002DBDE4EE|nr:SPOR domain-containing protein [Actinacidiphila sp. DG2A-62]MEC3996749.1 SPOR domain-containing protein [Actinacidiphila sp. DG2A-62]